MNPFDLYARGKWTIDQKTKQGLSLLHLAVIENRPNWVEALLQAGAQEQTDLWGFTPSQLSKLLNRSNAFTVSQEKSVFIYRNSNKTIHPISLIEFEAKLQMLYTDTLIFDSIETIYRVAKKCVRKMRNPFLRKMNTWALALHQNELKKPREHLFYVRWINQTLGYGLFAAKEIPALTYIGEYTGSVKKRNRRKNRLNDYVFSYDLCGKTTRWCIDAKERGNLTRFLNHSDFPNLTSRWIIESGISHIIFFTNQRVPAGAQLTYCYGPWYWRSRPSPQPL